MRHGGMNGEEQPQPASLGRRWLRRLAVALLCLVGALLFLVAGAHVYLASEAGGERLRKLLVSQVNQSIDGRLALQSVEYRGARLRLRGLELQDPEGRPVVQLRRLEVQVSLLELLHRK